MAFYAYMLRCSDESLYVGHTDDLAKRLGEHHEELGSRHTRSRRPVELVWNEVFGTREEAKQAERTIKGWNRAKKQALIDGRLDDLAMLSRRGSAARALRDALRHKAPQGRGSWHDAMARR